MRDDGEYIARNGSKLTRAFVGDKGVAQPPGVVLWDPKYAHNVGAVVRACAVYGVHEVWMSGHRVPLEPDAGYRLPREERMRDYEKVRLAAYDRPLGVWQGKFSPVAVEVREQAEDLVWFEHPESPVYVFGPEDGSLSPSILALCHRFVRIPSIHCLNLGAAVCTVLYDRHAKAIRKAVERDHASAQRR